ncbi:hypothetical protein Pmar_PMAR017251 [Perkinsus marinus ATCC 50983]|uniref:Uncharacterized protein n=1 Tax=Perkinsus marinus (strain ATCC 50983 / TXsc) TaxID=423536 RepID=C5LH31_PERM5|nr:hypothetical protein Pmar_PMAR017251 [Perkinsus marinus ATCC 50983]EER03840.1 hypothetical protein Pmar_PMAR017251 [Perkinsus marinus ATCC 50983]|eukprot:XP_002772024.1 hypothetical protein Pmar_PMAR017251 [Perkinsus marinus ATCC 50983]
MSATMNDTQSSSTNSPCWKILVSLATPPQAAQLIFDAVTDAGLDRIEFLAKISDDNWRNLLRPHGEDGRGAPTDSIVDVSDSRVSPTGPSGTRSGGVVDQGGTNGAADGTSKDTGIGSAASSAPGGGSESEQATNSQLRVDMAPIPASHRSTSLMVATCCACAVSAEAQRLLDAGHKALEREEGKATVARLVAQITPSNGPIPPYLIPDEKVMRLLSKSSSSYIDFKMLTQSGSEGNARKRLRTTTSGQVVEVYDDPGERHQRDYWSAQQFGRREEEGAFNKWPAQFARYILAVSLVDPEARDHVFTFLGYQCEISRIAITSPYRAVEADRAFRLTVPGIAATNVPIWRCYSEEFTAPFLSRFLSEVANRHRATGGSVRPQKGKGKGKAKGGYRYPNSTNTQGSSSSSVSRPSRTN